MTQLCKKVLSLLGYKKFYIFQANSLEGNQVDVIENRIREEDFYSQIYLHISTDIQLGLIEIQPLFHQRLDSL